MSYTAVRNTFAFYHETGHVLVALAFNVDVINVSFSQIKVNTLSFNRLSTLDQVTFYLAGEAAFDIWYKVNKHKALFSNVYVDEKSSHAQDDHFAVESILRNRYFLARLPIFRRFVFSYFKSKGYKKAYKIVNANFKLADKIVEKLFEYTNLNSSQLDNIIQ